MDYSAVYTSLIPKLTFATILTLISISFNSNAAILTFDFNASHYFESDTTFNFGSNEQPEPEIISTLIAPINFNIVLDVDFYSDPEDSFRSSIWNSIDDRSYTFEYEDDTRRYSILSTYFSTELVSTQTPFTEELQNLLPQPPEFPSVTSTAFNNLTFTSTVVTDIQTGNIIENESNESFNFGSGDGFRSDDGIDFNYSLDIFINIPTLFESNNPTYRTVPELIDLLNNNSGQVRLNETFEATNYPSLTSFTSNTSGYIANGSLLLQVPAPSIFILFIFSCFYIFRNMKAKLP